MSLIYIAVFIVYDTNRSVCDTEYLDVVIACMYMNEGTLQY